MKLFSEVVERCALYGGVILCFTVFWDENICPLFEGVRCAEVSVNGGSTVVRFLRCFESFDFYFFVIFKLLHDLQRFSRICKTFPDIVIFWKLRFFVIFKELSKGFLQICFICRLRILEFFLDYRIFLGFSLGS